METVAPVAIGGGVTLSKRRDAGPNLLLVTLAVPPAMAAAYVAPGQYIEIDHDGAMGFFVLASEPRASEWELLVRKSGGVSDALHELPLGTSFDARGPFGAGFPLARAKGRSLVIVVAGSALAIARPILRARLATGEGRSTLLLLGLRSAADAPLGEEIAAWLDGGVRVVLCLSKPEIEEERAILPLARREAGYAQVVLERMANAGEISGELPPSREEVIVFAAGPEGMLSHLRDHPISQTSSMTLEVVTNV